MWNLHALQWYLQDDIIEPHNFQLKIEYGEINKLKKKKQTEIALTLMEIGKWNLKSNYGSEKWQFC